MYIISKENQVDVRQIMDYLEENTTDPIPKFIVIKEIYKETSSSKNYRNAYNQLKNSKWYQQLASEQWDNGSWGRFHTQDTKRKVKQKFVTTEQAAKTIFRFFVAQKRRYLLCIELSTY